MGGRFVTDSSSIAAPPLRILSSADELPMSAGARPRLLDSGSASGSGSYFASSGSRMPFTRGSVARNSCTAGSSNAATSFFTFSSSA